MKRRKPGKAQKKSQHGLDVKRNKNHRNKGEGPKYRNTRRSNK